MSAKRSVDIAKWAMKINQVTPKFDKNNVGGLREIFTHPAFLEGSVADQQAIMLKASESRYIPESVTLFGRPAYCLPKS